MYNFTKSVLRMILALTFAVAFFVVLKSPFSACAADGSSAYGAQLPDYNSGKEIDVVEDYEADNTGEEDSASAIQKALNVGKKKASDTYKVVVRIPAGTYLLSKGLKIYSNTQLIMDDGATLVKGYESGCILSTGSGDDSVSGYNGTHNILIEGGTIDGNTSEYNSVYAFSNVRIAHANNVIIRNVSIINNKNGHHLEIGGTRSLTIEGCYFSGYTGSLLKEAIQLDIMNCDELFTSYEPFDDTACENVIIRNCTFKKLPRAIGSHSAVVGHYYTDVSILNNTFDNITNACLFLYNYKHCTISGNTMTSCGTGIKFNYMSDESMKHYFTPVDGLSSITSLIDSDADLVIQNNSITTAETSLQSDPVAIKVYGAYISEATDFYPAYNYTVGNIKISDNTIISAGCAISMTNVLNSKLESNSITINSESESIEKNLVYLSYCSGIDITDCSIKNSLKSGMRAENSSDISVSDCKISGCANIGIILSTVSDGKISKNTISSCSAGGIIITNSSDTVTCSGNVIKDFGNYGAEVSASGSGNDIKLKSNDFSGGTSGISCVEGGKAYLSGNSFEAVTDNVYADAEGLITLVKAKNFEAEEITENRIKLTWNAISEADGVEVYRRRASYEEEFTLLATVESGSIYQDESLYQGTNYIYKIVPYIDVDGTLWQNTSSDEITARTKINIETAYVECISQAGFTSKPITPKFSVTANSTELVAGTDYEYEYSDNIYVGQATITVTGKGNYIGTLTYNFDIVIGGDNVFDAASRDDDTYPIFGVQSKREYNVTCELTDGMALADSDIRLTSAERSINAIRLQVPIKIKSTAAVWTGSGYLYFTL